MKYKYLYTIAFALVSGFVCAQETYENASFANHDLNGTARYVGMGGAMDALGAEISTIGSNPAGIGLFRKSMVSTSLGIVTQRDAKTFGKGNKTNMSFDQIGFVYTMRDEDNSFLNFSFNYHKGKNFNQILNAADRFQQYIVDGKPTYVSSQNKSVYQKVKNGVFSSSKDQTYSYLDDLYMTKVITMKDEHGKDVYVNYPATDYIFNRNTSGYIGNYDFNISGNLNDRVYLGLTLGIKDIHYRSYSEYQEQMDANKEKLNSLGLINDREITGSGYDIQAGIIFRPIGGSPLRLGFSIATPTFYSLTTRGYVQMNYDMDPSSAYNSGHKKVLVDSYDFKFFTPWRFGLSVGHTIGNYLALGASYEYADYGASDIRTTDGYEASAWGTYELSSRDVQMKRNIESVLRGVSTFKLGMEFRVIPQLALRLGYNYLSPMYNKNGIKNMVDYRYIASPGHVLTTSTDYVNWQATNRYTCGVGFKLGKVNLDLAYQYAMKKGEFHPFNTLTMGDLAKPGDTATADDNIENPVNVSNKRSQLLFTVGYRF
jgi:hypothetical protein